MKYLFSKSKKIGLMAVLPSLFLLISSFDGLKQNTIGNTNGFMPKSAKYPYQIQYNSQEHKLIADIGVSGINIGSPGILPSEIKFINDPDYTNKWKAAKNLAVGFETNNESAYDQYKKGVQDNCYWYGFGQLSFNKINYIEDEIPAKLLTLEAYVGGNKEVFTFGDLVALYGDYRRTVYFDALGQCYLTNDENEVINFAKGTNEGYCPPSTTTNDYLHKIAYGLVPPYGKEGNENGNTAGDTEYSEAGWWGDEMLRIANTNETHFSNAAVAWYVGMHRLALLYVNKAISEPKYWNQALHYEASALHSLTDLFAIGHVVTNRDQCSFGVMKDDGLQNKTPYLWMENVITMGGGSRNNVGIISLSSTLPSIQDKANSRNDFLPSHLDLLTWAVWGEYEHTYHDKFNNGGATVRNFNGDRFLIYGDGKLHDMSEPDRLIISNAVQASVQSLFDAYSLLKNKSKSVDEIGKSGSSYFESLKYLPVFIESDYYHYFDGMWTLYAGTVTQLLGNTTVPSKCQIPFLSGADCANCWPPVQNKPCSTFTK